MDPSIRLASGLGRLGDNRLSARNPHPGYRRRWIHPRLPAPARVMRYDPAMRTKIDGATGISVAGLLLGWFVLNTLVASFGPIQHVAHFYDLPLILRDPKRLLTGVEDVGTVSKLVFAAVCVAVGLAPLLARLGNVRAPQLLSAAPFLLILVCGIVLYVRSSTAHIEAPETMGRIGGLIARWANGAMTWSGDVVARHITIGPGGYLSFVASAYLAVRGVVTRPADGERHTTVTRPP